MSEAYTPQPQQPLQRGEWVTVTTPLTGMSGFVGRVLEVVGQGGHVVRVQRYRAGGLEYCVPRAWVARMAVPVAPPRPPLSGAPAGVVYDPLAG